MNFVKMRIYFKSCNKGIRIISFISYIFIAFPIFVSFNGCSDKVKLPSVSELSEFENASVSVLGPSVDFERLYETKIDSSPYRVKPEEVLEITMPSILNVVTTDEPVYTNEDDKYICRISKNGNITLPVIGEFKVADKNLAQIETDIIQAYYPEYIASRPSVFIRILEYKTFKVSVIGAVNEPGLYSLRTDQMSLVSLLMEAGGIIDEGAALIKIIHSKDYSLEDNAEKSEVLAKQGNKQVYDPITTEASNSTIAESIINEIETQLKFRQFTKQSMKGILTITHDNEVLLSKEMDISQELERLVLLKQFSLREPRVSIIDVERNLCSLAELLKPGSSSPGENSVAYHNVLKEIEENRKNNLISREKATDINQGVFTKKEYSDKNRITDTPLLYKINPDSEALNNQRIHETFNFAQNMGNQNVTSPERVQNSESIILPVKGLNIPFADVTLRDGDRVIVERLTEPLFSVVGLVNRQGNFPYPPDVQYNLMQALAFAGGLDQISEPRYATIYRLKDDGKICHVSFKIVKNDDHSQLTEALNTIIKPGDIVSVEHTPRTRKNVFLDRILRFNIGTYFNLNDAWNNE